jgi:serine/threonine protein phosphatase PrpC
MTEPERRAFEKASQSVKGPEKAHNGDHALTEEHGEAAVLAVADGVGSRPCDWRASAVACESALEEMAQTSGTWPKRVEDAVEKAHWAVGRETGRCEGMLAAIVIAVWPRGADELFYAGVGDARIYRIYPSRIEQITGDDKKTKTIRQDSRTSLPGAPSTYRRDVLTQALGGNYDLSVNVSRESFPPGAGLALVSDGAYPLGGFEAKLRRVFGRLDLEEALSGWLGPSSTNHSGLNNEDDATIALMRRSGLTEETREQCRSALEQSVDCRELGLHPHLMVRVLLEETQSALQAGKEDRVRRGISYMRSFSLTPGQNRLAGLLDRIADHSAFGKGTFEQALELARRNQ